MLASESLLVTDTCPSLPSPSRPAPVLRPCPPGEDPAPLIVALWSCLGAMPAAGYLAGVLVIWRGVGAC